MRNTKRPTVLSIVCMLGFAWVLFTFPGVFSPSIKKLGVFMPAIYGLIISATFISFIGVWYMKRWGPELYVLSFCGKMLFFVLTHTFSLPSVLGIVFSIWFTIMFLIYYHRMDVNL
jgi:hypothetical protein